MPAPLRESFRAERFGAPYNGGYRQWPLRWLIPAETARNVYETLTAVQRAMNEMEGESLNRWRERNPRLIAGALAIEALRADMENDAE